MGSIFASKSAIKMLTPKVEMPPNPPSPVDYEVDDLISGTQQRIVTQPDGTKRVVISENLTPEQQQVRDNLKRISDESLAKYESLVNDPFLETMPQFKEQVQTIYNQQVKGINDSYVGAARATETAAARFGTEDSTAAGLTRAENTKNLAGALEQANVDKIGLTNSIRQQEMGNQLQAYGAASGRQDTLIGQGLQTLGMGNSIALANAARNDNYQNNLWQNQVNYTNQRNAAKAQGLSSFGQILGSAVGFASGGGFGKTGANKNLT
jgi:hypothetical protein